MEIAADRDAREPILIQATEVLRSVFKAHAIVGRWDQCRFCVVTSGLTEAAVDAMLRRAAGIVAFQFSVSPIDSNYSLEEILTAKLRPRAKIAMLAD